MVYSERPRKGLFGVWVMVGSHPPKAKLSSGTGGRFGQFERFVLGRMAGWLNSARDCFKLQQMMTSHENAQDDNTLRTSGHPNTGPVSMGSAMARRGK